MMLHVLMYNSISFYLLRHYDENYSYLWYFSFLLLLLLSSCAKTDIQVFGLL